MYKISAIYSVNGSQETRETRNISGARSKYIEWLKQFILKMSLELRVSVTSILYRRKLSDITQVPNVYVIHIKFLHIASFLRKLNPLNFGLTY